MLISTFWVKVYKRTVGSRLCACAPEDAAKGTKKEDDEKHEREHFFSLEIDFDGINKKTKGEWRVRNINDAILIKPGINQLPLSPIIDETMF